MRPKLLEFGRCPKSMELQYLNSNRFLRFREHEFRIPSLPSFWIIFKILMLIYWILADLKKMGLKFTFWILFYIGGYYFRIERIERLLQVLIWIFLPDTSERPQLGLPPQANVDFRAACFCHRLLVDVGFVCSVCLSIFCKFTPFCSTCNTVYSNRLVKKKKSK